MYLIGVSYLAEREPFAPKDFEKAISIFNEIIMCNKEYFEAYYQLGLIYKNPDFPETDYVKAKMYFECSINFNKDRPLKKFKGYYQLITLPQILYDNHNESFFFTPEGLGVQSCKSQYFYDQDDREKLFKSAIEYLYERVKKDDLGPEELGTDGWSKVSYC
jgi:tetratricopeptide (TPR) repeat protein